MTSNYLSRPASVSTLIALFCILFAAGSCAKEADYPLYVEGGPVAYVSNGYSLIVRKQLAERPNEVLGIGVYGMNLPADIAANTSGNQGKGWSVKLRGAAGIFWDSYSNNDVRGWSLGVHVAVQDIVLSNNNYTGNAELRTLFILPRISYQWYPFDGNFYLVPFVGYGYTHKLSGSTMVGTIAYKVPEFTPLLMLHAGYRFD